MAKPLKPQLKPRLVTCASCRNFHLDTSGPSYNVYTHIYFMGTSDIGCDPDHTYNPATGKAEIFATRPRVCPKHKQKD